MNVELLTLTEIIAVSGEAGDFTVNLRKKPRYIDMDKCIACGVCAEKCPRKVDDEFNMLVSKRKAAYIKYGQTVPLKYAIDPDNCIYLKKGKCKACEKFCPTGAVNFDDKETFDAVNVGAVILAPGFTPFDPSIYDFYGYRQIPDVVTGLEYERYLSASGPCMGHLVRPSDGREPKKIAWLQCVGSRNTNRCDNGYCSNVCCMYAIKQALVTGEHLTGDNAAQTIFNMDIRSHGKEFERYYESAKEKGVQFVKARPHSFMPGKNNMGVVMTYFTEGGEQKTEQFDMAVLSIGLEVSKDAGDLAAKFGIELDQYRFALTNSFSPVSSTKEGVFVTGAFQGPKDIPQSVAEASSAASEAARLLVAAKGTMAKTKTYPDAIDVSGQEPKIGVFVCSCGINIANVVDVRAVCEYAETLPNVAYVENNLFTCSTDTQDLIANKIDEHGLNRIVVAACTPRTHEPLFQDTLREAGLNAYLLDMANIRNQNSWVHQDNPEQATDKAKHQVRMAVSRVAENKALDRLEVRVVQKALVIGGGVAGMNAALGLADLGFDTVLVEKSDKLGGTAWSLKETWKGREVRPLLEDLIKKTESHDQIEVLKNAQITSCSGSVGNFKSNVKVDGSTREIDYGVAVVAIGGKESKPTGYLYGEDERVMTHFEFDAHMAENDSLVKASESVVFVQCAGSRDSNRPYCSRVCCTHSVKTAIHLKEENPDKNVFILHRDIRTYGAREDLFKKARDLGVIFIRYTPDKKPVVAKGGNDLIVETLDPVLRESVNIHADYVVLASAIEANESADLVDLYKCGVNADGFLNEAHPKLRPVDMSVEGLFVAGLCNYPKPIDEAVAQAKAAVSRAGVILAQDVMKLDAIKSEATEKCDGCGLCVDVCPYLAIGIEEYQGNGHKAKRIQTDPALCKGCGLCAATCPKDGVIVHGFTMDQLRVQVDAALEIWEITNDKKQITNKFQ